jgi:hypothetical protein
MVTTSADRAIESGLAYLASKRRGDGAFGTRGHSGNVAVTSLAAMAFLCAGNQPNRGRYGRVVTDALRFVLSKENVDGRQPGFLHNPAASPYGAMYEHGFGTLFLAEAQGMVHQRALRESVREKLRRSVRLIVRAQNFEGGWRYWPTGSEADLSVTVCQMVALRAAKSAGVSVPRATAEACVSYVKSCQDRREGWFRYRRGVGDAGQGFARTAAGVVALNSAGVYKGPEVEAGLRFLLRHKPPAGAVQGGVHFLYGHYYAVQAMWTAGGGYWAEWFPAIRDELLARQRGDGWWADPICTHYGTALACIILQVPNNYLPILQK